MEVQRFNQVWLWIILIFASLVPFFLHFYERLSADTAEGGEILSPSLIFTFVFFLALMVFFRIMHLKTRINSSGIHWTYYPFFKKKVTWKEVEKAKVLNYGFVGGWGIRIWTSYGTVYNIRGNKGLALELKSGKRMVVGTQKEQELKAFLGDLQEAKASTIPEE